MRILQILDNFEIFAANTRQVDIFHVNQAQQFAHRLRHVSSTLVARSSRLRNSDLRPELRLVHPELPPDVPWIQNAIEQFHLDSSMVRFSSARKISDRSALCDQSIVRWNKSSIN